jgi:multiple sugar transport system substrate-binding protein
MTMTAHGEEPSAEPMRKLAPRRRLSDHELNRIIAFLRSIRDPFDAGVGGAGPDPYWNLVLALVESHVEDRPLNLTGLIDASGATYGTGNRLIARMLAEGRIEKVSRSPRHKTSFLRPSDALLDEFASYATTVKAVLARTFGLRSGSETDEYYFGGSYFAAPIIAPLSGNDISSKEFRSIKFLLNDDNYFSAMRNVWSDFRNDIGRRSNFDLRPLPELYKEALRSLTAHEHKHDIIALNMPWLGRFAQSGLIAPLDDEIAAAAINPLDFHPSVWATGRWQGRQFGIPIYCTIEFLAARRDLFEEAGLAAPRTFAQTLEAARTLHDPAKGRYGIAWNGARGMPIASSFMLMLASAGSTVIELPRRGSNWIDELDTARIRPQIDTEAGRETIEYMRELIAVSPPDIASTDWNLRVARFLRGEVAMAYVWTMRAAHFEYDMSSKVKRRVQYLAPPSAHGRPAIAPVGGFLLTIPSDAAPSRRKILVDAIAWTASPEAMKAHARNGFPVAPRFSVSADPEVIASSPIVGFVDKLARQNLLHSWPRPPVPQYVQLERMLGEEIHDLVFSRHPPGCALRRIQSLAEKIFGG